MMNAINTIALAKAVAEKDVKLARPQLSIGIHSVKFAVAISGNLSVAADTEKTPTASIPLKEVLALFIARSGITRAKSIALLNQCMADAMIESSSGTGAFSHLDEVVLAMRKVESDILAKLPKTVVKGTVKSILEVKELEH